MKKIFSFVFLLLSIAAGAQTRIRAMAMNYGDSIVIRWAPGNPTLWIACMKSGYRLRRAVLARGADKKLHVLDTSSILIRPWSLDEFGHYFQSTHDSTAAGAAQLIYGKTMQLTRGKGPGALSHILDKYNEQQNRYAFALMFADMDAAVATALGLRYVDRPLPNGFYYSYEILPLADRLQFPTDTGRALAIASEKYVKEKFPAITAEAGDKNIRLIWDYLTNLHRYSAYIIERSTDGEHYERVTHTPFYPQTKANDLSKPIEYNDTVVENYKPYYYRVRGLNAFGDLSDPSPAVKTHGVDLTPPQYPIISDIKNIPGTKTIRLAWTKKNKEPDFKGFVVGRSNSLKGPFTPISPDYLPFTTTSFTDSHPKLNEPNYYIVAAVDTAGNSGRSMPAYMNVTDKEPPARPAGLAGAIDSSGKVTIRWHWNQEPDLAGYKIYFANAAKHRFVCLTPSLLSDTLYSYFIPLNNLTRRIFYKVVAYDRSNNASKPSDMLALSKPDQVPPAGAAFNGFHVSDTAVILRWRPGLSDDAAAQDLFRRRDSSAQWEHIATLGAADSQYVDRSVSSLHTYTYAIETIDSSHLNSGKSYPLRVYVYGGIATAAISDFTVAPGPEGHGCRLTWTLPKGDVSYYIVYRGENKQGLRLAANIPGSNVNYADDVGHGNYQYAIKAFYANGNHSALSEIRSIDLP